MNDRLAQKIPDAAESDKAVQLSFLNEAVNADSRIVKAAMTNNPNSTTLSMTDAMIQKNLCLRAGLSAAAWSLGKIENYFHPGAEYKAYRLRARVLGDGDLGKQFRAQKTPVPKEYRNELIAESFKLSGHEITPLELGYAWSIVQNESGFIPGAQNNWDENAKRGHPSKGWAQCIDSTFQKYKAAGHDDIWNPVDNLAAGTRYADERYGKYDKDHDGLRWVAINLSRQGKGYITE